MLLQMLFFMATLELSSIPAQDVVPVGKAHCLSPLLLFFFFNGTTVMGAPVPRGAGFRKPEIILLSRTFSKEGMHRHCRV